MPRAAPVTAVTLALLLAVASWATTATGPAPGGAAFTERRMHFPGTPARVRVAPIDANGSPDIVVSGRAVPFPVNEWIVAVYANDGAGGFEPHWGRFIENVSEFSFLVSLQLGDLDRDDHLDVTLGDSEGGWVYALNDGQGRFPDFGGGGFFGGYVDAHMLDHYDDDEILDLVTHVDDFGGVFLDHGSGTGTGTFTFASGFFSPAPGSPTEMAGGDLDDDGEADLVIANGSGVTIIFDFPSGAAGPGIVDLPITGCRDVVVADLDDDGLLDVAATLPLEHAVALFHGDGARGFSGPLLVDAGRRPEFLAAGRLDGDGRTDLVVSNPFHDQVIALFNTPGAPWRTSLAIATGERPGEIEAADLDRDGDDDLVVVNRTGSSLSVLRNHAIP